MRISNKIDNLTNIENITNIKNNKMTEFQVYEFWKNNDIFSKTIQANKSKPEYLFYDGPPFATGLPHYGHILAGMIKDSILRYAHNNGMNVPRFNGYDCHGLPIEYEIEKDLNIKTTQQVIEYGIGNYNESCRGIVLKYSGEWEKQMGRLGRWVDFKNEYKTMDLSFMNSVWWVFKNLYDKGRIYEGVKIMGYSTSCGTPLSNFEIQQNYQEVNDDSLFIKIPLKINITTNNVNNDNNFINMLSNTYILVWTTTPWTLPANYALCVGKNIDYVLIEIDNVKYICGEKLINNIFGKKKSKILEKFKGIKLIGFEYFSVFDFNNLVDNYFIIAGDFVTDSDGTGIVHIAPSYGADDYQVCLDNNLITKESKLFQPLDSNGYVTDKILSLKGMFYKNFKDKTNIDLNTWVVIELKKKGYYYDKRSFKHNYPFCWRSDTPLIYCAVNSWFIKVEDMRDKLCELNKKINWVPKNVGDTRFENWLSNAKDWGISRNRFWGTPIPIWKSESGEIICIGSSYELEKLAGLEHGSITDLHRHNIDHIEIFKNGIKFKRVEFVLDCWMESGAMPYGTVGKIGIVELLEKHCKLHDSGLKYDSNSNPYIITDNIIFDDCMSKPIREKFNILPADFIAEGLDQTRGWFYTLLVLSASLFDTIPFKNVIVNGLILAEDGKKMSKRLKNYPNPMDIVEEFGSDALRLYLLGSQATKAEPLKFSKSGVHNVMKDIIIPLKNTIVFWKEYLELYVNTYKSNPIISIKNSIQIISNPINLWILRKYSELRNEFNLHMTQYNLKNAVGILYKLIEILNNGYIKMGRQLIKGKETLEDWIQSLSVLSYIINFILNDFKSIMPFFCESQYQCLKIFYVDKLGLTNCFEESIHLVDKQDFVILGDEQIAKSIDFDIIYNIIVQIYQLRSLNNISLKKPISNVDLIWNYDLEIKYSSRFKNYLTMILDECNLLNINILNINDVKINKTIVPNKSIFFKTFGTNIASVFDKLNKLNYNELENIIINGNFEGYNIDSIFFDHSFNIELLNSNNYSKDLIYKEFNFGDHNNKIIILMNKMWSETNDMIYYYRLVATSIQKSRKNAGLHPWDDIYALWEGNPKFTLDSNEAQEYINKITRIKFTKNIYNLNKTNLNEHNIIQDNSFKLHYSYYFDNIDITIHLVKLN